MNQNDFTDVVNEQIEFCKDILCAKSKEYSTDTDKLHNFKNAAGMMGCDPKEALAGMMAKHTISVYDMCRDGKKHDLGLWEEKITDHINYLLLLKALVVEEAKPTETEVTFFSDNGPVATFAEPAIPASMMADIPHSVTYELKGEKK